MRFAAPNRTWAEVSLDSIAHNFHAFGSLTKTRVMCVIKANGYGHGSVPLAKRLVREGCDAFGVATLDEGIELRRAGIDTRFILLLNHIAEDRVGEAIGNNLTMTVFSKEMARRISGEAAKPVGIHVKIDTGMTRVGINPGDALETVKYMASLPNVEIEGVYTNLSSADETGRAYTEIDRKSVV